MQNAGTWGKLAELLRRGNVTPLVLRRQRCSDCCYIKDSGKCLGVTVGRILAEFGRTPDSSAQEK